MREWETQEHWKWKGNIRSRLYLYFMGLFFFLSPCWEMMGKWMSNKSFCVFGSFLIAHCKLIYIHSNFFLRSSRSSAPVWVLVLLLWQCTVCFNVIQSCRHTPRNFSHRKEQYFHFLLFHSARWISNLWRAERGNPYFQQRKASKVVDWNTRST